MAPAGDRRVNRPVRRREVPDRVEGGGRKFEAGLDEVEGGGRKFEGGLEEVEGGGRKFEGGLDEVEGGGRKFEGGLDEVEGSVALVADGPWKIGRLLDDHDQ